MRYDININGKDLINGKFFESNASMKAWVTSVLKNSTKDGIDVVLVTSEDNTKHRFESFVAKGERKVTVNYSKYPQP